VNAIVEACPHQRGSLKLFCAAVDAVPIRLCLLRFGVVVDHQRRPALAPQQGQYHDAPNYPRKKATFHYKLNPISNSKTIFWGNDLLLPTLFEFKELGP
jgi:hypothetical protein